MAINKLQSPEDMRDYVLRALGAPVINIELDEEQIYDRIDDALQMFISRHYNGTEELIQPFFIQELDIANGYITLPDSWVSVLELIDPSLDSIRPGEEFNDINFRLANSDLFDFTNMLGDGGVATYHLFLEKLNLIKRYFVPIRYFQFNQRTHKLWINGIQNEAFAAFATTTEDFVQPAINNNVQVSVSSTVPLSASKFGPGSMIYISTGGQYQIVSIDDANHMTLTNTGIAPGAIAGATIPTNSWIRIAANMPIVVRGWSAVDNDLNVDIWGDNWLKSYCVALCGRQWGANVSKYSGIQLPGNITMNGQQIFDRYDKQVQALQDKFRDTYELPCRIFMG